MDSLWKGDNLKWYPSKEGGYANNLLSCRAVYDSHILESDFVRFMTNRVRDLERFVASKWLDLKTNYLQKGGYDVISVIMLRNNSTSPRLA
ncbi:hypothetical protein J1N35_040663 [Gossypium stocksii]|uniref:Uncharacterized protein n=1 Tax=Gossypium stocksii TaxID=47602 RepID=A0A9D3ZHY4_9ROSI|nr:hypothetical protein J1N35_040663 [Gossypium stocksii]